MPKKLLYIISGLIIIVLVFAGIRFFNNPSFSSCEKEEKACGNDNSLFLDKKTQINPEFPQLSFIQKNSLAGISCSQIFSSDELEVLGSLAGEELLEELLSCGVAFGYDDCVFLLQGVQVRERGSEHGVG